MKTTLLHEANGQRTFVLVFAIDENPVTGIVDFAAEADLTGSEVTGIGAFSKVTLAYFDWETKDYQPIEVDRQVEVASFLGNIARDGEGEPKLHAHLVVAGEDGDAMGGHLLAATVRPTLEVIVTESPTHLQRRHDPQTGLPLLPS
ncbi:MAG: PPC domain-containing DNA-binding protein [Acidimicrobiia bacterium]